MHATLQYLSTNYSSFAILKDIFNVGYGNSWGIGFDVGYTPYAFACFCLPFTCRAGAELGILEGRDLRYKKEMKFKGEIDWKYVLQITKRKKQ